MKLVSHVITVTVPLSKRRGSSLTSIASSSVGLISGWSWLWMISGEWRQRRRESWMRCVLRYCPTSLDLILMHAMLATDRINAKNYLLTCRLSQILHLMYLAKLETCQVLLWWSGCLPFTIYYVGWVDRRYATVIKQNDCWSKSSGSMVPCGFFFLLFLEFLWVDPCTVKLMHIWNDKHACGLVVSALWEWYNKCPLYYYSRCKQDFTMWKTPCGTFFFTFYF